MIFRLVAPRMHAFSTFRFGACLGTGTLNHRRLRRNRGQNPAWSANSWPLLKEKVLGYPVSAHTNQGLPG